jgi:cytochrome c-type biogenesis protein CcmF
MFVVRDRLIGRVPDEVEDLGLRLSFINVDPEKQKFTFGVSTTAKDYVILKAVEKPFINLLWSGTLLMTIGFGMAFVKRRREVRENAPQPTTPDATANKKTTSPRRAQPVA